MWPGVSPAGPGLGVGVGCLGSPKGGPRDVGKEAGNPAEGWQQWLFTNLHVSLWVFNLARPSSCVPAEGEPSLVSWGQCVSTRTKILRDSVCSLLEAHPTMLN